MFSVYLYCYFSFSQLPLFLGSLILFPLSFHTNFNVYLNVFFYLYQFRIFDVMGVVLVVPGGPWFVFPTEVYLYSLLIYSTTIIIYIWRDGIISPFFASFRFFLSLRIMFETAPDPAYNYMHFYCVLCIRWIPFLMTVSISFHVRGLSSNKFILISRENTS